MSMAASTSPSPKPAPKGIEVQHSRAGRKSPSATLLGWEASPFTAIHSLYFHDKHGTPLPSGPMKNWEAATDEQFEWVLQLLKENWCPLLEVPCFTWQFVTPRSLHDQLRVHRHWSCFAESHQLYEPTRFAEEGDYFKIPKLTPKQRVQEDVAMFNAQWSYQHFREQGVLPALARGVLPLHVNLALTATMNLRSLFQTVVLRRCHILQGTYWNLLLEEMKRELCEKVDARFHRLFELQPCDISKVCISPIEQELRAEGQDPHAVCPRYVEIKKTSGQSTCCGGACLGCLPAAVKAGVPVQRSIKR